MSEERGSLRPLVDAIGGVLSNPIVLEGLIAGISAFSASRRTKSAGGGDVSSPGDILDMLPSVLPLLSVFAGQRTPSDSSGSDTDAADNDNASDAVAVSAAAEGYGGDPTDVGDKSEENSDGGLSSLFSDIDRNDESAPVFSGNDGDITVSDGSRETQRENLLLAIRPFLSESRRSAADAMVQVNRISGMFRQR